VNRGKEVIRLGEDERKAISGLGVRYVALIGDVILRITIESIED
jgi:hypothetical protein